MAKMLKITQKGSLASQTGKHRATMKALGLGKIRTFVVREDEPHIRGMLRKVAHLVQVEEVEVS